MFLAYLVTALACVCRFFAPAEHSSAAPRGSRSLEEVTVLAAANGGGSGACTLIDWYCNALIVLNVFELIAATRWLHCHQYNASPNGQEGGRMEQKLRDQLELDMLLLRRQIDAQSGQRPPIVRPMTQKWDWACPCNNTVWTPKKYCPLCILSRRCGSAIIGSCRGVTPLTPHAQKAREAQRCVPGYFPQSIGAAQELAIERGGRGHALHGHPQSWADVVRRAAPVLTEESPGKTVAPTVQPTQNKLVTTDGQDEDEDPNRLSQRSSIMRNLSR